MPSVDFFDVGTPFLPSSASVRDSWFMSVRTSLQPLRSTPHGTAISMNWFVSHVMPPVWPFGPSL